MTSATHTILIVLVVITAFSLFLLWAGLKYIESCAQFLGIEQDDFYDEEEEAGAAGNGRGVPEIVVLPPAATAAAMVMHPPAEGMAVAAGRGGIRIV